METNLYETLYRYFNRLSQTGYIPDSDVESILVLIYMTELKETAELTEDEINMIDNAMSCLTGGCLIPYVSCKGTCTY